MKFRVILKDPDALSDAIKDAVKADLLTILEDEEEREAITEIREQNTNELCRQWFKYGELLMVEIDTKAGTCLVVKV